MLQLFSRKSQGKRGKAQQTTAASKEAFSPADPIRLESDPLSQCLQLRRYAYLLANRRKWDGHANIEKACRVANEKIDDTFAIVPEGFASLPSTINDDPGCPEETIDTEPFLLARHSVTNAEFQNFVDAGGYEQLDLWPKDIWPHIIDFRDLTACPGARFWRDGRPSRSLLDHPVVGICFYEASAYAKWAGYRLPTEAQWQMAATWRIRSEANTLRRYPWGDALDTRRCNIWASGIGRTVAVQEYPDGASPNQVFQLVGNVWEWTACEFDIKGDNGGKIISDMRLTSIRGGAFDTYFPMQATGTFRTGLVSLARPHNVGFRCAFELSEGDQ